MIHTPLTPTLERRAKPRIECAYPAVVRRYVSGGKQFEEKATLTNLSAGGLYLQLKRAIDPGDELFVLVHLSNAPRNGTPIAAIAVRGPVVRSELQSDGQCGIAIKVEKNRFL